MGILFKRFKTRFRYSLKPVFAMLVAKRRDLEEGEWRTLFDKIRYSIHNNANEYLGNDLPDELLLRDILDEIFLEFLKEIAYHDATAGHMILRQNSQFG